MVMQSGSQIRLRVGYGSKHPSRNFDLTFAMLEDLLVNIKNIIPVCSVTNCEVNAPDSRHLSLLQGKTKTLCTLLSGMSNQ